jgi:ferredoxin
MAAITVTLETGTGERLNATGPARQNLMRAAPSEAGSRLSCQIVLAPGLQGLAARLPDTQY